MNATRVLRDEHEIIRGMAGVLISVAARLQAGVAVQAPHIERLIQFIKEFADKCHYAKEEQVLFPAIRRHCPLELACAMDELTTEHSLGRGYVRGMSDALGGYALGDRSAASIFAGNARRYAGLIFAHTASEEQLLFPIAEEFLSQDEERLVRAAFDGLDEQVLGPDRRQELLSTASELMGIYATES